LSEIAGITYYMMPHVLLHGPFPANERSVFDHYIDKLVDGEFSTKSTSYVDIGHPVKHTVNFAQFPPSMGTYRDNIEMPIELKTSVAGVAAYRRILRDGTVVSESSHDGTSWKTKWYTKSPAWVGEYTIRYQLRTSGNAVAYARKGVYVRACILNDNHGFYVLRG